MRNVFVFIEIVLIIVVLFQGPCFDLWLESGLLR